MRYWHRLLRIIGATVCLLLIGYTFVLALRRIQDNGSERLFRPDKTRVRLLHKGRESSFLTERDVMALLPFKSTDTTVIEADVHKVESLLSARSPYISEVVAYVSPWGKSMNIDIVERSPLVRYYARGESYYVDDMGKSFANRSGAAAHLPLVTGTQSCEEVSEVLYRLGEYLKEHEVWQDFVASIHIVSPLEIHLYPRVGDYVFVIDDLEDLDDKLSKIPIFYKKILPKVGANKYKYINLSYKGQIVCKKR